jgi:hypothetical protein
MVDQEWEDLVSIMVLRKTIAKAKARVESGPATLVDRGRQSAKPARTFKTKIGSPCWQYGHVFARKKLTLGAYPCLRKDCRYVLEIR